MKNGYKIAGLDFIFDRKGQPWFIEANSASTVHKEIENIYGEPITVKAIAKYINSLPGKNFCIFQSKNHKFREDKENSAWLPEKLKGFVNKQLYICYMEKNLRISRNYFPDHNFVKLTLINRRGGGNSYVLDSHRRKVNPDVIMRNYFQLNPDFEKEGIAVINSMAARDAVWFKHKCYEMVKSIKGINIPKYFLINNNTELKQVLKENKSLFRNGYVLKPLGNSLGRGIKITESARMPRNFEVKLGYMLQQRIHQPKIHKNKYWDVRCFVINGKYIAGVKRVSKNKVTNITKGAYGELLDKKYEKKIKKMAEKIANLINQQTQEWVKSDFKYMYEPEKPSLRAARWHPIGEE
ncbi:MAG: hypothetical protein KAU20_04240 [Nanoarchaeota archaeon]|nr:hypothetical protein [Nanoarchaeota archaeon]